MQIAESFKSVESIVRYIAPGYSLLFIFWMVSGFPDGDINRVDLMVIFPFLGIAWYSMHRTIFNIIDVALYKFIGGNIDSTIAMNLDTTDASNRGYVYARLANVHLSLVVSGQMSIVSALHGQYGLLFYSGLILFSASFISYGVVVAQFSRQDVAAHKKLTSH